MDSNVRPVLIHHSVFREAIALLALRPLPTVSAAIILFVLIVPVDISCQKEIVSLVLRVFPIVLFAMVLLYALSAPAITSY